jgi:hypothetical protein
MLKKREDPNNYAPFGSNSAGLFDLLVDQILTPNDQSLNSYIKNITSQQPKVGGVNLINQTNQINQMGLGPQQQFNFINSINGLNGMNTGAIIGGNQLNNFTPMNPYGQIQFGGYGNMGFRNGWI